MSQQQSQQQQQQQQQQHTVSNTPILRRAVYVHVSDLISAYNVDHKRLELELARVKSLQGLSVTSTTSSMLPIPAPDEASVSSQKRLQPPRGGYNLCVLVGKVNVVVDKLRVDRSRVRLAEVDVGDETGTVSLRARDEQIDVLTEISRKSGAAVLRNCTIELFQGKHIRLAVTKWGKLSIFPDNVASTPPPPSKSNRERNFSLIDLSLVASEMVEHHPVDIRDTSNDRNRAQSSRQVSQVHQQQQRRTPRERRQVRGDWSYGANAIAVPFPELNIQPHIGYSSEHSYGYGESMNLQHYRYTGRRQTQGIMPPTPHQYMQLQLQQYDYHRRQFEHMHAYHEQMDRNRQINPPMPQTTSEGIAPTSGPTSLGPSEFPSLPSAPTGSSRQGEKVRQPEGTGPWKSRKGHLSSYNENVANVSRQPPPTSPTARTISPARQNPTTGKKYAIPPQQQTPQRLDRHVQQPRTGLHAEHRIEGLYTRHPAQPFRQGSATTDEKSDKVADARSLKK